MRTLLRRNLGRTLNGMTDLDRLAAAWTVACGKSMAGRGEVVRYADAAVEVLVTDQVWLAQMTSMQDALAHELARIAGLPVRAIHFSLRRQA